MLDITKISSSPDDVWYVVLYFAIYLGTVSNTAMLLKMGSIEKSDRLVLYIPLLYFPSLFLHGEVYGANVNYILTLIAQWTIPAALFGYCIGLYYHKLKKRKENSSSEKSATNEHISETEASN